MKIESYHEDLEYGDNKIKTKLILESSFSKEIRILLRKGQIMKEHKAPFPIIIHVLEGEIKFGVLGDQHILKQGSILSLEGNVLHDLTAQEDSIVRLTILTSDKFERVKEVTNNS